MTAPEVVVKKPSRVRATWAGEHRFQTGKPDGPTTLLDGNGKEAQTPPEALLSALASCSGVDVVDILAKRRTPADSLVIDVEAQRRDQHPRRYEHIVLTYHVKGEGIERAHAERAVSLAFERYCSVAATFAPDIVVEAIVVLNGETGAPFRQPVFTPPQPGA